jgi:hypothetical protein
MLKGQPNLKGRKGKHLTKLGVKVVGEFLTIEAHKLFKQLHAAFLEIVTLAHFKPGLLIWLETDASGFAILGVISQLTEDRS